MNVMRWLGIFSWSLLGATVLFFGSLMFLFGAGSREGQKFGNEVKWQNGTVSAYDYCWHPGSYDCRIEWDNGSGKRKVLLKVGDCWPQIKILENGDLEALYFPEGEGKKLLDNRVIWKDLKSKPVIQRQRSSN